MITVQNLSAFYDSSKDIRVLDSISFSVNEGEIISLLGPNGSGKSTLLSLLSGISLPGLKKTSTNNDFSLMIQGKNIESYTRKELSKKVAFLAQNEQYSWSYSVFEVVLMGRYAHSSWIGDYSKEDRICAQENLEKLGISSLQNRSIYEISGGEYQRAIIARSLTQGSQILLLDEPFTHLDIQSQHSLLSLLKTIAREKNITVIMSLHDINMAPLFSKKTILLSEGKLIKYDSTASIFSKEYLKSAYNADFGFYEHPYYNVVQAYIKNNGHPCK